MRNNKYPTEDILLKGLMKRIRTLIETYNSQSEFGREINTSRSTVSAIYNGRIENLSFTLLRRIVEGTGCSEKWLISGEGNMYETETRFEDFQNMLSSNNKEFSGHESKTESVTREKLKLIRSLIDDILSSEKLFN